jgi:hypothetical protein
MHPCREYWGQDVAYGSLVAGEQPRRPAQAAATEIWIIDSRDAARPAPHAELAALMRRIGGFAHGEEALRQSAAHLQDFLQAAHARAPAPAGAGASRVLRSEGPDDDGRILGIATLHRTPLLPPGQFAAAAGIASRAEREEASAGLCAEFMRQLTALGAGDGVSRIDWVMARASDNADTPRSHLGATRVAHLAVQPFEPGSADAARP